MKHFIRPLLAVLIVAVVVLGLPWFMRATGVRVGALERPSLFIPPSFGEHGYYRGDNVEEWRQWEASFSSGPSECISCHQQQASLWGEGVHAVFGCETCHGPGASHIQEGPAVASLAIQEPRGLCSRCHDATVPGRPESFPQVVPSAHAGEVGCTTCHNPHSPWPPGQGGRVSTKPTPPAATPTPEGEPPSVTPTEPAVSFSKDVMPIFLGSCTACHGALGGLSLESYEDATTTGSNGPAVSPGDPEGSLLYQRLLGLGGALMPLGNALPQEKIELIRQWILDGAPDN